MDKSTKRRFENFEMFIMGQVRIIPYADVTIHPSGRIGMSVDEYNRILNELHVEWKKKRKSKKR